MPFSIDGKNWKSQLTMGIEPVFRPILLASKGVEIRLSDVDGCAAKCAVFSGDIYFAVFVVRPAVAC